MKKRKLIVISALIIALIILSFVFYIIMSKKNNSTNNNVEFEYTQLDKNEIQYQENTTIEDLKKQTSITRKQ